MLQSAVGPGIEAFRILGFYINKRPLSLGRVLSAPIPWWLQAWFRDMAQNSVLGGLLDFDGWRP